MIDKNLGIVAIATLVAGAGFLLKGEKTSNKSAEGKEFMAQSGRAIDKRKIKFGIDTNKDRITLSSQNLSVKKWLKN